MKRRPEQRDKAGPRNTARTADAEREDFARAMADVVRLAPDPRGRVRAAPHIHTPRASTRPPAAITGEGIEAGSEADFVAPGVNRRELRKLKRVEYVPGRRLDLHGKTAGEAAASVQQFIDHSHRRHRCVCIIHGRGLHSEGSVPILKTRVRACLRQHPAVLAYADAPRTDGGTGAVYVLLRK